MSRLFGLIPAAGRSRRMGRSKLLLPWKEVTVIEHLVSTLFHADITAVIVVVRSDDLELQNVLARTRAIIVVPEQPPPEMRDSVEIALQMIRERFQPSDFDGWLLIPADHPVIEPKLLNELLNVWNESNPEVLVPKLGERRGHPTLLRWSLATRVEQLPSGVGINSLLRSSPHLVTEWPTDRDSVLADLDTPDDYAFWKAKLG